MAASCRRPTRHLSAVGSTAHRRDPVRAEDGAMDDMPRGGGAPPRLSSVSTRAATDGPKYGEVSHDNKGTKSE